jgi:hypothetical protein
MSVENATLYLATHLAGRIIKKGRSTMVDFPKFFRLRVNFIISGLHYSYRQAEGSLPYLVSSGHGVGGRAVIEPSSGRRNYTANFTNSKIKRMAKLMA